MVEAMTVSINEFFDRNIKIIVLTILTYAALC